jgi:hypothetical protein
MQYITRHGKIVLEFDYSVKVNMWKDAKLMDVLQNEQEGSHVTV